MDFFGTAIARRNNITSYADNSKVAEVSNIFKFMMASNHIEASTFFKIKNNEEITNYKMARGHSLLDKLQYVKEDKNLTITILDTETTGLDQLTADIIEFAAVKFNMDGIISTCDVYRSADVIKDSKLSEEISELTGISYDLLRTEGVPEEKFVSYVKDYMCSDIVIAYNSSYDIPVIYSNIPNCDILKPNQIIDLLDVTHALFPDLKSYKLGDVGKVLGLQGQNTHRAIDDVLLTYELFLYVINHLNVMKKGTQEKSAVSDSYVQCEKTLEFLWDLCSHAKAEEAIMYLKALGIHDVILKELWKDNSTVFMNLYRILLQPYKMIWGHVPVLTPYNLKNDYYDTLIVFSAKKEHLDFIKSRCNTCILLTNQQGTKDLTRMELI